MSVSNTWDADLAAARIRELQHLPGALLPILHALQEELGYVDESAVPVVAQALNISHAEVHGVITFYHDQTPAARPPHSAGFAAPNPASLWAATN